MGVDIDSHAGRVCRGVCCGSWLEWGIQVGGLATTVDLSTNGIGRTAIAHDIREQVYLYLKSLALLGYAFDGSPVGDIDLKQEFLPAVTDVVRRDEHAIAQFTPFLVTVTDADIERLETERERTVTKKKRATRGRRGVVLPDREPIRTVRMRIGGEVDDFGRPLARLNGPREPFIVRLAPPRRPPTNSRRAAALAARASITEMSNTDQDDRFETLPPPSPASRTKRARVGTATPAPNREETPSGPVRPSSKLSERLIPKEERTSVPLDAQLKTDETPTSRPGSSGKSEWKCASCGRPESGLKGMHKAKGPNGPDTICSSCGKSMIAEIGRMADPAPQPNNSMVRAHPAKKARLSQWGPDPGTIPPHHSPMLHLQNPRLPLQEMACFPALGRSLFRNARLKQTESWRHLKHKHPRRYLP